MSVKRQVTLWVAILSLGVPTAARADGFQEWLNVCGGTSFITCASVKLWVTGTTVKLQAWNLSGGASGGYRGSLFTQISLLNLGSGIRTTSTTGMLTSMTGPSYIGTAASPSGLPTKWTIADNNTDGQGTVAVGNGVAGAPGTVANALANNCSVTAPNLDPLAAKLWMSRACGNGSTAGGSSANDYAVEMTFSVNQTFDPTSGIGLGITAIDVASPLVTSYQTVGVYQEVYATPEPATIFLLGSGLFGIGAAGLKRRRKDRVLGEAV